MNMQLFISGFFMVLFGIFGKPSEPITAPANNASILLIMGVVLMLISLSK